MEMTFFWIACMVLFFVPLIFVWNQVYQDGIVGRTSLLTISGAAALFLLDPFLGDDQYNPPALAVLLIWSFALFLVWHLWRFHRRVLRRECPPDCPVDRRQVPDRRFRRA